MLFRLENVSYEYKNGIKALEEVSISVREGERVAVLGANGSGKSTLLKLLDGLIFPSGGTLYAFDRLLSPGVFQDSAFRKMFRQRVGFVFQDSDVQLFCPTVWEEVIFGPLQLDLSPEEVERRGLDALELLGIGDLKERFPYQLSGGEKKRVAIAATLSANPEVLLLDEPTNGLDPRTQKAMAELLWDLSKAGKTILLSTNDLSILEDVCDRVLVLSENHRFLAEGEPHQILSDTDLLLKANLIHEHIHRHGDDLHLHRHTHIADHDHRHASLQNRHARKTIKLSGLSCPNCARLLEHLLLTIQGVEQAHFAMESREMELFFDPRLVSYDELHGKIEEAGYSAG